MKGSTTQGTHKSRDQRIREAMVDLRMTGYGCMARVEDDVPIDSVESFAAFARASSLFLRKLVLDSPQLLDADTCQRIGLRFARLRNIPRDRRTLTPVAAEITGGEIAMQFTPEDSPTTTLQDRIPVPPQSFEVTVDWPLPGMANWTEHPTPSSPWRVQEGELFDSRSEPLPDRNAWLGQQLIRLDNHQISLYDLIKITVDTEGAHSVDTALLMQPMEERDRRVVQNSALHILNALVVAGFHYNHAIVIETAMYLYRRLFDAGFAPAPGAEMLMPDFSVTMPDGHDAFGSETKWLVFAGGFNILHGNRPRKTAHRITAPGGR